MSKIEAVGEGIFTEGKEYYTLNLIPGETVYGEKTIKEKDFEYRHWNPNRSKLGALLKIKGSLPIKSDMDILYLGAGDGTTVSHISDIVTHGKIFAVEKAPKPYRNLLALSKKRKNIFPILADAKDIERYRNIVSKVDFLYQDIAQRDQVNIFMKNTIFLKEGKYGCMAVKSRSIDVTNTPENIFKITKEKLIDRQLRPIETVNIGRWQKDHALIIVKK